jgi:hypothetical protein
MQDTAHPGGTTLQCRKVKYTSPELSTALLCMQGDARDWALMYTSVAVFVFMAMQMFRMYAYWYYAAGLRPIVQTFH